MLTLKEDIKSNFRDKLKNEIIYGKKGDKVKLIAEMEDILIVELNNTKFPVRKNKVE